MTAVSDDRHSVGVSTQTFRTAMADLPAAVSIITTATPSGEPRGATVSAVTSLSKDPAMLLVCLDNASDTLAALEPDRDFLVHIVSDELQDTAMAFATKGSSKFDGVAWSSTATRTPRIDGATTVFACTVHSLVPGGDHTIVVGDIHEIDHDATRPPVVYHRQKMHSTQH